MRKAAPWIAYLVALILAWQTDLFGWALIAFAVGMMFHWKYWVVGFIAFFVAAGWKKPSL